VAVAAGPVPIRVAIAGSGGRMGQTLIDAVLAARDLTLTGALEILCERFQKYQPAKAATASARISNVRRFMEAEL